MDPSKFLDWIKLSPKYLLGLAVFAGLLLFAPNSFIERLGLVEIVDKNRTWVGLAFILVISLLSVNLFEPVIGYFKEKWNKWKTRKSQEHRLNNLTLEEKAIMRGYILKNTRTQYLRVDDGVVRGMEREGLIYMASNLGGVGFSFNFAFNIHPWAWTYLSNHQDLIKEGNNEFYDPDSLIYKQN
jgi:hypothetical protein